MDDQSTARGAGVPEWLPEALACGGVGMWCWEVGAEVVTWSAETFALFGLEPSAEALAIADVIARLHPDDRDALVARARGLVESAGTASFTAEHRVVRADGSVRWLEEQGCVVRDASGRVLRMLGTSRDVTLRKEFERAARASEERLWSIVQNTPNVALQGYDLEGHVLFWNPASEALFGWTADEALGRRLDELLHTPEEMEGFLATLRDVHLTGTPTPPTEYPFRKKSGERGVCLSTIFRLSGPDEPPIFACMDIDQTESRRLRERAERAERLESLGRLAGGIAHDFNNLLTSIFSSTTIGLRAIEGGDWAAAREELVRIQDAGRQGAALTQQLLGYGRRQIAQPKEVDLADQVGRILRLVPLREGVELRFEPASGAPKVRLDPGQLHQVVSNLVINARDAMPEGGLVRVSTEHRLTAEASPFDREGDSIPAGDWVVLRVEDDGVGMSDEVISRVLEPFFTTKSSGKGTGLGLPTCYGILRQNGGHLVIESALGRGTRVEAWLPAVARVGSSPPIEQATILVVDDDAGIRGVIVEELAHRAHHVLEAEDAASALEVVRGHAGPIHLLLCDLRLPGMDGRSLADTLRVRRPGLRVLFVSGAPSAAGEVARFGGHLLSKPFGLAELQAAIERALADDA